MAHLTASGAATVGAVVLGAGVIVGWGAGRAWQRAADAWQRFRDHVAATGIMWRRARYATGEALGTVLLAVAVLTAAGFTAWLLTRR